MTERLELGTIAREMTLTLTRHTNFRSQIVNTVSATDDTPQDFPDGAELDLVVGETTWSASIQGPTATWSRSPVEVDALIATAGTSTVGLYYTDGDVRLPWALGMLRVVG